MIFIIVKSVTNLLNAKIDLNEFYKNNNGRLKMSWLLFKINCAMFSVL